ncbi:MAG TPA: hypothetical protein VI876_08140 [Dehalococcoidia bacterium]|nr:hypothetical protein [Dehalococcoidia bacterium]
MALGFYFSPVSMTAQQYDDVMRQLDQAGAGAPKGRTYHSCFGSGDKMMVFDIWESQAEFEAFGATLMPILQKTGIDVGQPDVMPIHNTRAG